MKHLTNIENTWVKGLLEHDREELFFEDCFFEDCLPDAFTKS